MNYKRTKHCLLAITIIVEGKVMFLEYKNIKKY